MPKTKKSLAQRERLTKSRLAARRFAQEYLKNDLNATRAYKNSHPNTKSDLGARVEASKCLTKPIVQQELIRLLDGVDAMSREGIEADAQLVRQLAIDSKNGELLDKNLMNRAKLRGLIIDKAENKDTTGEMTHEETMAELERRSLTPSRTDTNGNRKPE